MRALVRAAAVVPALAALVSVISCSKGVEMEFRDFVEAHTRKVAPMEKEANLAYWRAANSGKEEDYTRYSEAQLRLEKLYTDPEDFALVKRAKESGKLADPLLRRTADILYLRYLGNQTDPLLLERILDLASAAENKFTAYAPVVDGDTINTNGVYRILAEERSSAKRRATWEASKNVGPLVRDDLIALVKLRNESARAAGFPDYYSMALTLGEQSEEDLVRLFAELEELTREPFLAEKASLDRDLAAACRVAVEDLRPWHYHDPYFQELPQVGGMNLDAYYAGRDVVEIAKEFYGGIGMPVEDILAGSDLYERPGKNPHAFCTDIDRAGDIRILANMKNNGYWMETILHELGHGTYDKYIDPGLPFLLRSYPASCLTEAAAEFFGRLSQDSDWMKAALGIPETEAAKIAPAIARSLRLKQLIFARWSQVMFHFERRLYRDPDVDLNALWWDLVERYQFVKRPEGRDMPDWATKIHVVMSPVYYHNYMLGELVASQVHHRVRADVIGGGAGVYGNPAVGAWFREVYYKPGNVAPWHEHVAAATGEPLTAEYFVEQFTRGAD